MCAGYPVVCLRATLSRLRSGESSVAVDVFDSNPFSSYSFCVRLNPPTMQVTLFVTILRPSPMQVTFFLTKSAADAGHSFRDRLKPAAGAGYS